MITFITLEETYITCVPEKISYSCFQIKYTGFYVQTQIASMTLIPPLHTLRFLVHQECDRLQLKHKTVERLEVEKALVSVSQCPFCKKIRCLEFGDDEDRDSAWWCLECKAVGHGSARTLRDQMKTQIPQLFIEISKS